MIALSRHAASLVRAVATDTEPRALRGNVEALLDAFDRARPAERDAAVRSLTRALARTEGAGAQVLSLALGALVEAGGSAELAWPGIAKDLLGILRLATRFASAAVRRAKTPHVDAALEAAGAELAKKHPREAAAWKALPARSLAAVACLIRSKKVRKQARRADLVDAAWALSEVIPEVGYLLHAARIVDGEQLLVWAPHRERGWRFALDGMASTGDLYILLADALAGRGLPGKRPDPAAVSCILEGTPTRRPKAVRVAFELHAWDGASASDEPIPADELVADLPGPVVLVRDLARPQRIPATPAFEALHPELRLVAELDAAAVTRAMAKLRAKPTKARRRRP